MTLDVVRELDVRNVPPPKRHPAILLMFDSLRPGQGFVLVNDHEPKPLLYFFQAERAGLFEWNVLEAGPERYRVEIRRRALSGPRSVAEFLEADHQRLDTLFAEAARLLETASLDDAAARFAEFACGLERHIAMEESVLFPAFERLTGMVGGPTTVMRMEHAEIREFLRDAAGSLGARDGESFALRARALRAALSEHNVKEEEILYPMTDESAGGDRQRDDLVRRMQTL